MPRTSSSRSAAAARTCNGARLSGASPRRQRRRRRHGSTSRPAAAPTAGGRTRPAGAYGTGRPVAGEHLSARRQPLRAGLRPRAHRRRQLVGRRRDHARSTTTPNWHGMMVSLGGIDKMGHMWGPEDRGEKGAEPGSVEEMRHMPFVAKNADKQVGRIVDALERARHTRRDPDRHHRRPRGPDGQSVLRRAGAGRDEPACGPSTPPSTGIRSDCNWYYGDEDNARQTRSTSTRVRRSRRYATGWPGTSRSRTRTRRSRRT